jgi:hypothetical protein
LGRQPQLTEVDNSTMATPLNIYANAVVRNGPPRPPRATDTAQPRVEPSRGISIQAAIEMEMARILEAAPAPGESVARAFDNKEIDLKQLFETLTREECIKLHATVTADDATALARLSSDRRARVTSSLLAAARKAAR